MLFDLSRCCPEGEVALSVTSPVSDEYPVSQTRWSGGLTQTSFFMTRVPNAVGRFVLNSSSPLCR